MLIKSVNTNFVYISYLNHKDKRTRMATFIKTKFKKLDDYRIPKYIKINLPKNHYSKIHEDKAIISCKNVKRQSVKNGRLDFLVTIIELLL